MKGTHKVFFIFDFKIFRSSIINKGWFILRVLLLDVSAPCIIFIWRRQTSNKFKIFLYSKVFTAGDNLFYFIFNVYTVL